MSIERLSVLALPIAFSAAAACSTPPSPASPAAAPAASTGAAAAPAGAQTGAAAGGDAGTVSGVVAETMRSGGYTYARLTSGGTDVWIAANEMPMAVGETLTAEVSTPMDNFHSRTLNRDFARIYFVGQVARNGQPLSPSGSGGAAVPMATSHDGSAGSRPAAGAPAPAATVLIERIPAPPGGHAVADVWAKRAQLAGTVVIVRGQVMKRNNEIMDRNWFHLQDGSGSADKGTHDLTITTREVVNVGDVVTVTGTVRIDQDFGAGYAYAVMLENAVVKK